MRVLSDASVVTVYGPAPKEFENTELCRSLPVSSLLRELMLAAADVSLNHEPNDRNGRLVEMISSEVSWLLSQARGLSLQSAMPRDPRLIRVCKDMLKEFDRSESIDDAARAAGMSRRTFTRTFRRETGISFNAWRLRVRLNAAICRLNAGASITEVAFECGYNSPSAFAAMFKRCLGAPPSEYLAGFNQVTGKLQ